MSKAFGSVAAILKAAYAKVTVSSSDQVARDKITELENVVSTRLRADSEFEKSMNRMVKDMGK